LLGKNLSQSWDKRSYPDDLAVRRMPPPPAGQLTEDEVLSFIEWVDLGALWDGIPGEDQFSEFSNPVQGGKR
jgi:hypothetical protein